MTDLVGTVLGGRYQVIEVAGTGGMSTVYKAVNLAINQVVALKVLRKDLCSDENQIRRFFQEARASSLLKHPNTVRVFDFGRLQDGRLFIVMEYLEGLTLAELLAREGPLPLRRALRIACQIAKSLAEAHARGIIHRDLKPDNIFITKVHGEEDFVKVFDFGIAKFFGGPRYTQTGLVFGTPLYLSPEQALGRALDGRSDLYSLGVIMFEMIAGRPPFCNDSPVGIIMKHINAKPPKIEEVVPHCPPAVSTLIASLLEKDRGRRPARAELLVEQIEAILGVPRFERTELARPSQIQGLSNGAATSRGEVLSDAETIALPPRTALTSEPETLVLGPKRGQVLPRPVTLSQESDNFPTRLEPKRPAIGAPVEVSGKRRKKTVLFLLPLVVLAASLAGIGVAYLFVQGAPSGPEVESISPGTPLQFTEKETPKVQEQPKPIETKEASRQEPQPNEGAIPGPIKILLETVPKGARIYFSDGRQVGTSPAEVTLNEAEGKVALRIEAEGYKNATITIDPSWVIKGGVTRYVVTLERLPPKRSRHPKEAPKGGQGQEVKPTLQWE